MNFSFDDVIVAQATPPGSGRRGMIRITGPDSFSLIREFLSFSDAEVLSNGSGPVIETGNETDRGSIVTAAAFDQIDLSRPFIRSGFFNLWGWERKIPVRVWFWPTGRGFTGQETVELHLPGSPPILNGSIDRLCRDEKIRLARPGEFTLRAFMSGRLDLTQAEAVLGVIDARNDSALETALAQLSGNLGGPLRSLRESLIETLAHLEAGFDFAEEDIEFISRSALSERIGSAADLIEEKLAQMETRTDVKTRGRILLTGLPNSGKSSLFNRLIQRFGDKKRSDKAFPSQAIVSDVAGTTRDYLEAEISLGRHFVLLIDTAGMEDLPDGARRSVSDDLSDDAARQTDHAALERRIQHQSEFALQNADLILLCVEANRPLVKEGPTEWERKQIETMEREGATPLLVVLTKMDMVRSDREEWDALLSDWKIIPKKALFTSARSGEGMDEWAAKAEEVLFGGASRSEVVPETAVRCRQSLRTSLESLRRGERLIAAQADEVLIALEIRTALDQLGLILGAVQTDDILDQIFSRFCVGK